jgi:ACR3 family arsenite efflux pump ArsB
LLFDRIVFVSSFDLHFLNTLFKLDHDFDMYLVALLVGLVVGIPLLVGAAVIAIIFGRRKWKQIQKKRQQQQNGDQKVNDHFSF